MADKIKRDTILGKGIGIQMTEDKIDELAHKLSGNGAKGGPKTVEGKKQALRNLRLQEKKETTPEPEMGELPERDELPIQYLSMEKCWNDSERDYFIEQWERYTKDFEMNTSADEALLTIVIMEEIAYNRLYIAQMNTPATDLSKQISECIKRHNDSVQKLGISRTQRIGMKAGKDDNIATLVQQMDKQKLTELEQEKSVMLEEEEILIKQKRRSMEKEVEEIQAAQSGVHEDKRTDVINPHKEPEDIEAEEMDKSKLSKQMKDIFDIAALR